MDKLVRRIIKVQRGGEGEPAVVYEKKDAERDDDDTSGSARKVSRKFLKAEKIFADEALRLHDKSGREREGGWLIDAPGNIMKAHKKAYNEARKAVPFKILPKV